MRPVVHRCRFGPGERRLAYYQYLPVAVDGPCAGLTVQLRYDRRAAVIDLGLFGPDGFRGWSGGERERVTVGEVAATPGYLPGAIARGAWSVVLGLYRVPDQGVDVVVEAACAADPLPPEPPPPPVPAARPPNRPPGRPGWRWVAGDLHAHSVHSDGKLTIDELAATARSQGLDFLAVTDHNTVSHHPHLPAAGARYRITLLAGQEVTTDEGHANCLGDVGWVDFRGSADDWQQHATRAGGLLSINHPLLGDWSWRRPMRRAPDLIEVWHRTWDGRDGGPLDWWRSRGAGTPVGGSDFHRPGELPPGFPTTWVEVESDGEEGPPAAAAVLDGLRAGRVAMAAGPQAPVAVRRDGELVVVGGAGLRLVRDGQAPVAVAADRVRMAQTPGLCRLERDDGEVVALTP